MTLGIARASSIASALLYLALTAGNAWAQPAADRDKPQAEAGPAEAEAATETASEPATETAAESAAGTVPAAGVDPAVGQVHLVLFSADQMAAAGARVRLPTGEELATGKDGDAWLELPERTQTLQIAITPEAALQSVEVPVVAGETTSAIFTFAADGTVATRDVRAAEQSDTPQPTQAAEALPTGTVLGRVFSADDGAPVPEARIYVAGTSVEATTDAAGKFRLEVPEGTRTLSVIHTKFSTQTLEGVNVSAGGTTEVEVEVTPVALELDDFVVTAPHVEGGVAAVLDERRSTAAVTDAVGAEDISRMAASDAAQAAQRVVGATIVGGRFVYVRGLGERYTNALLNGAPLPSPEPDRATVPLDLFPAKLLESLDISKTFTPDVPADFAGGSVRILTRSVPEEPLLDLSLSTGFNSQSTFTGAYTQEASSTDWLGFDDGMRSLSPAVPDDYQLRIGSDRPDGEVVLRDELTEQAANLNSPMTVGRSTLPPDVSGSVLWGRGFDLGGEKKAGMVASLLYSRKSRARSQTRRRWRMADLAAPRALDIDYDIDRVAEEVRWGAFASSKLVLSEDHDIGIVGMHSQLADALTDIYEGYSDNTVEDLGTSHQEFPSRALSLGQLQGNHTLNALGDAEIDWTLSLARAVRDEPDTRDVVYTRPQSAEVYSFLDSTESGRHFFSEMVEDARFAKLDWTQPLTEGDFGLSTKLGGMLTQKEREFRGRRFQLLRLSRSRRERELPACGETFDPIRCPEDTFAEENIGSVLSLNEGTQLTDSYNAKLNVYAGYLMGDVGLGEHLRFIGGARVEATEQSVFAFDQFNGEVAQDEGNELDDVDVLPAVSVVISPNEDMNVRLAASRTLARPQLRELAPFSYIPCFGCAPEAGNPDLLLTKVLNGDLRFEYFPSPSEVLAASVFVKDFTNPIEPIVLPGSTNDPIGYRNAAGAFLYGAEFEARKSLAFVAEPLEDFTIIASLMLADSQIRIKNEDAEYVTNQARRLVQQAPYVVNVAVDYEGPTGTQFRVLYNVSGKTIVEVGANEYPDVYEHPRHQLDLAASQSLFDGFKLKLSLRNLLNAEVRQTLGAEDLGYNARRRYREGVSGSIGATYSF